MSEYYAVDGDSLSAVADAIRAKGGTSGELTFPGGFVDAIDDIETGGGGATVEPLSVTQNGTYTAPSGTAYSPVTVNVSGGASAARKAVNFIDFDGTILHSYTEAEFNALSAMPENPSHTGLTAQGWNWTLAAAKAQLTAMPGVGLTIGQMYITDDGKTRMYCHFEAPRLSPYLGLGVNGTVVVDWGDGTATDTMTGTSLTTATHANHTYASAGDYIITLDVTSGTISIFGASNFTHILKKSADTTANVSKVYANCIKKIEMGSGVKIGDCAFYYCYSLESVTIPNIVTEVSASAFRECASLIAAIIPSGVTSIGNSAYQNSSALEAVSLPAGAITFGTYVFSGCSALSAVSLPAGATTFGNYIAQNCWSLAKLTIPAGISRIGNYAFSSCYGLGEIHFLTTTPPTVANSNAFNNLQTDCIIYVPTGSLSAYTSATNYPSSSTYTYREE